MTKERILDQLAAIAGGIEASLGNGGEMTPAEVAARAAAVWSELSRRVILDEATESWGVWTDENGTGEGLAADGG